MYKRLSVLLIAAAVAVPATVSAEAYTTDTTTFTGVGDQIGSGFDQVTLGAAGGNYTGNGTYLFSNVAFTAGVTSNTGTPYTVTGTFVGTGNVGNNFTFPVKYQLDIGNVFDTLTLGGNYFKVNTVGLHFNTLVLTSAGETSFGQLTAVAGPIPEPATWALMIAGFSLVGFAARRRATAVTA